MSKIQIDFTYASIISDRIEDQKSSIDDIVNFESNDVNSLPAEYFKNTIANMNTMKKNVLEISKAVDKLSYAFDSSIEKYYRLENDLDVSNEPVSPTININRGNGNKFTWGYKTNGSEIRRVDRETMEGYLASCGATKIGDHTYSLKIDGVEYKYSVRYNTISINNGKEIRCDFYLPRDYKNGQISSTVTILGGTGNRQYGPIGDRIQVSNTTIIGNKSLLIVPFSGDENEILSPNGVIGSNKFGDKVFGVDSDATRSVVAVSEGGRVVTESVAEDPKLFDNVVFVNGSTHYLGEPYGPYIPNGDSTGFKDTNVYYVVTRNGWPAESIAGSIDDLIASGVDPNNITLISNEPTVIDAVNSSINIDNSMPSPSTGLIGHGDGAYKAINQSGIINYLTMM